MSTTTIPLLLFSFCFTLAALDWPPPAPPLPAPAGGRVVQVDSVATLNAAVADLRDDDCIVIAAGSYHLTHRLEIAGVERVSIRGATGDPDDVVLHGDGMASGLNMGMRISNAADTLVADLTITRVRQHCIQVAGETGVVRPTMYNLYLYDNGESQIKASHDLQGTGAIGGTVAFCRMGYTTAGPHHYIGGVDIITGLDWVIRDNLFYNQIADDPFITHPALLCWQGTVGTVAERNVFINCSRSISFGLTNRFADRGVHDHQGGRIYNNFIYRDTSVAWHPDVGIHVCDSPDTLVAFNTVFLSGTYGRPIETRYGASGIIVAHNICDGMIWRRDGNTATLTNNRTDAQSSWFTAAGEPTLRASAPAVNAGPSGAIAHDLLRHQRSDNQCDLGCVERNAQPLAERVITLGSVPGTVPPSATAGQMLYNSGSWQVRNLDSSEPVVIRWLAGTNG